MKNSFLILTLLLAFLSACHIQPSELKLSPLFGDEMVLQQQSNVAIWGQAVPGSKVEISGSWGKSVSVETTNDSLWLARIETPAAGGPYELTLKNSDSTLIINNILIGEVWLCSGQSNMEMPLAGWPPSDTINNSAREIATANYPQIRMFTVARNVSSTETKQLSGSWQTTTPQNAPNFSATAYFFGKKLYKELNVPIGLINSSWGGTPVEAWIKGSILTKDKDYSDLTQKLSTLEKEVAEYDAWLSKYPKIEIVNSTDNDPLDTLSFFDNEIAKADFNDAVWPVMQLPTFFEKTEVGEFDGVVWFRKEIDIPANWAGKELKLQLGPIDDRDWTYFNGELVGKSPKAGMWKDERSYTVPADLVKEGKAIIAIRLVDTGGGGGLYGSNNMLNISQKNKTIPLSGEWKYLVVAEMHQNNFYTYDIHKNELAERPVLSMPAGPYSPTMLYNGMIGPLLPYTIKGAIWYQGESNVGRAAQYSRTFPLMIENWRQDFENPDMPFYFVQIAPYLYGNEDPTALAKLRDAQRLTLNAKNTGMAVTMDIGNVNNIHPANKQDVGNRLALWALAKDYGKEITYSGPLYKKMEIENGTIRIYFTQAQGGLKLMPGSPNTIEIAGEDGNFYPAKALIDGEQLILSSAKVADPVKARYAYYENSVGLLFNGEGLPASSFSTEDK